MKLQDLLISQLNTAGFLYDGALKGFSEADARFQPCPGGQHAIWLLMHLAVSDDILLNKLCGTPHALGEHHVRFRGGSTPDPKEPLALEQAQRLSRETRARIISTLQGLAPEAFDKPAPPGLPPGMTRVGDGLGLIASHAYWHFGQLLLIRRMLGKGEFLSGPPRG